MMEPSIVGHGAKFGRKKEEAIAALLSQRSIEEAARAAGVAATTLSRWLKTAEFQNEYRLARRQAVSQSTGRLQQASGAAVTTLLKVMVDKDSPPASKIRACEMVLEYAFRGMELEDVEARVARLEQSQHQEQGRNGR
jgi:hypothetical protein